MQAESARCTRLEADGQPLRELASVVLRDEVLFPGELRDVELTNEPSFSEPPSSEPGALPILGVFLQTEADLAPRPIGVAARVLATTRARTGSCSVRLQVLERIRLEGEPSVPTARVSNALERCAHDALDATCATCAELERHVRELAGDVIQLMPELAGPASSLLDSVRDPGRLADLVAAHLGSFEEQSALLETLDIDQRLRLAVRILTRKLADLRPANGSAKGDELRPLWPFEAGAAQRLVRAEVEGRMDRDEARRIAEFVRRGFVVWERLIEPELVDELLADVRGIRERPGYFLTTDHKNSRPFRFSGADFDSYESIFDAYVNIDSARAVCFHPTILRFLELLFESRPVAFQQLLFQRSNGHALHQDTAYVSVEEPLRMVATWIALEDVVPGRGELTYFEGSHRIPHYLFADGSKRFMAGRDDESAFRRHIDEQCRALGCVKRDFIAKKGDVLLWAADLVHGSNPRTRPEVETRRACVTHYCPETTRPFWFRTHERLRGIEPYDERASFASSFYKLPKEARLVRPSFRIPDPTRIAG